MCAFGDFFIANFNKFGFGGCLLLKMYVKNYLRKHASYSHPA